MLFYFQIISIREYLYSVKLSYMTGQFVRGDRGFTYGSVVLGSTTPLGYDLISRPITNWHTHKHKKKKCFIFILGKNHEIIIFNCFWNVTFIILYVSEIEFTPWRIFQFKSTSLGKLNFYIFLLFVILKIL